MIVAAQILLALVFAVAGVTKLANVASFRTALVGFGVASRWRPAVAVAVPLGEMEFPRFGGHGLIRRRQPLKWQSS